MLFAGCSSEDIVSVVDRNEQTKTSLIKNESEAIATALSHMEGRGSSRVGYSVENTTAIRGNSSRSQADTLMYAINLADNKGFVLVSAVNAGEQILGYADEGTIDTDNINPNSGFNDYLNAAKDYVALNLSLVKDSTALIKPLPLPNPAVPVTTYEKVPPRVDVKWGQNYPEGIYCPNGLSGCVQTAMAQIMTYLRYPTSISLAYDSRDKNVQELNWDSISTHQISTFKQNLPHGAYCNSSEYVHNAIGRLCRELGRRNGAEYLQNVTIATLSAAHTTFKSLLPSGYKMTEIMETNNYTEFFRKLKDSGAVAMYGGLASGFGQIGHAWICSGGERITTVTKGVLIDGEDLIEVKTFFHFNWGDEGKNDGYFAAGVFDTSKAVTPSRADYSYWNNYFIIYKTL